MLDFFRENIYSLRQESLSTAYVYMFLFLFISAAKLNAAQINSKKKRKREVSKNVLQFSFLLI